jgi:hypothetical protein
MTHGDLVNEVTLALSAAGALAWKNNTGVLRDVNNRPVRYGCVGSPDVLACVKGRFVGVECKVGKDRQRTEQKAFAAATDRAQGLYILARSVDDVTDTLRLEGLL